MRIWSVLVAALTLGCAPRLPPGEPLDLSLLGRRVSIADLPAISAPASSVDTTAMLATRGEPASAVEIDGLRFPTGCGPGYCVDGAALIASDRPLLRAEPDRIDRAVLRAEGAWLERVVRPASQTPDTVSLYVATSSYSGGAHAQNELRCSTFARSSGRPIRLDDLLPARAARRILARLRQGLPDARFDARSLRLELGPLDDLRAVLCGEGDDGGASGTTIEVSLDDLPALLLLR